MKILLVVFASVSALLLGGCETSRPLIPDEEYEAMRGPAGHAPDPINYIPQPSTRPAGW
jgi:hypothetical protein